MNNSDYRMHRITHEREGSAKNDELMERFLTVTKGYFVWRKEPLIEKYHINHPFTYYYIDIRNDLWPKGENGNGTFFGLNKQEQKVFLIDTYKDYAEPIIKNIIL